MLIRHLFFFLLTFHIVVTLKANKNRILCWLLLLGKQVSNLGLAFHSCPNMLSPSNITQLRNGFYMNCSQLFGPELRPTL